MFNKEDIKEIDIEQSIGRKREYIIKENLVVLKIQR